MLFGLWPGLGVYLLENEQYEPAIYRGRSKQFELTRTFCDNLNIR